jgi:cobalt-zinc-cadmium efflux system membrane fusion protein
MKPWHVALPAALVAAAVAVVFVVRGQSREEAEPPRDVPTYDGHTIAFSPTFAQRAGVELAPAELGQLAPVVNVTGTVAFDPEKVAVVSARIAGRARSVLVFPGDRVKAGDPLAVFESAELGHAQADLLAARAHAEAARMNAARERQLADVRVSGARDAELAKASSEAAVAELSAAEQRVRALGGDRAGASGELGVVTVTSPIAGKVVESHVSRGQSVEPSAMLFRVADLSRLWVELAVFERELARIHAEDAVEISPQTNSQVTLSGKVAHVGDVINLETRSGEVRVVVDNREGQLRPGQSISARIHIQRAGMPVITLPREAVTTVDGKPTVFVARSPTSVEPRTVVVGAQDGVRVEITTGLTAGDKVAVRGVFALKSEIFR